MITVSTLYLIAAFSRQPGDDPGPSSPNRSLHGYEVVEAVMGEVLQRAIPGTAGNIWPYTDGLPADAWADALRSCGSRQGVPLIVELTAREGTDGTVITYGATGVSQALTIAGQLESLGWPVTTAPDLTLSDRCASVRVSIGSVNGTLGRSYLKLPGWTTSFGSQLASGILAAIAIPETP